MPKAKLGYWKIRGLGEPLRLLMEYKNAEYENVYYELGPAPEYNRDCWYSVKHNLGLGPFPNLPYYIEGDIVLVESNAILNHLSRKFNLDGDTDEEKRRCDMMLFHTIDVFGSFTVMCYKPNFKELRPGFLDSLPGHLKCFEEYLGDNAFFAGSKITKCDFAAYEMFKRLTIFEPGCLEKFPALQKYVTNFEAIPAIKAYHSSNRFLVRPINNPSSQWH